MTKFVIAALCVLAGSAVAEAKCGGILQRMANNRAARTAKTTVVVVPMVAPMAAPKGPVAPPKVKEAPKTTVLVLPGAAVSGGCATGGCSGAGCSLGATKTGLFGRVRVR